MADIFLARVGGIEGRVQQRDVGTELRAAETLDVGCDEEYGLLPYSFPRQHLTVGEGIRMAGRFEGIEESPGLLRPELREPPGMQGKPVFEG